MFNRKVIHTLGFGLGAAKGRACAASIFLLTMHSAETVLGLCHLFSVFNKLQFGTLPAVVDYNPLNNSLLLSIQPIYNLVKCTKDLCNRKLNEMFVHDVYVS